MSLTKVMKNLVTIPPSSGKSLAINRKLSVSLFGVVYVYKSFVLNILKQIIRQANKSANIQFLVYIYITLVYIHLVYTLPTVIVGSGWKFFEKS